MIYQTIHKATRRKEAKIYTVQKEKDDAIMNFVSRQAQEAILDPNLPESYKDAALDALLRIAKKRSAYNARGKVRQSLKQSRTIYEADKL